MLNISTQQAILSNLNYSTHLMKTLDGNLSVVLDSIIRQMKNSTEGNKNKGYILAATKEGQQAKLITFIQQSDLDLESLYKNMTDNQDYDNLVIFEVDMARMAKVCCIGNN